MIKKIIVYLCLALLTGVITSVFWYQEFIYSLPTPVPKDYKPVPLGQKIEFSFFSIQKLKKPLFLHFFNPNCPCSRFNMKEFKNLVRDYGNQIDFVVMVHSQDSAYSANEVKNKFDLDIPVLLDQDKKIAQLCGVYSTPQAVIIDNVGMLYYRGNYNKARYCTDERSSYAKIALDSLLKGIEIPEFGPFATRSYGCALPSCKK